jgi:N-acetylneuraminic acid mutarotase
MEGGETGVGGSTTVCPVDCSAGRTCDPTCEDGWVPTSVPPGGFSPRERAAYASLGNQLFVWGGLNESGTALNSGALYDPRTDSWKVIANDANTPSPRSDATAVWTGGVVVVYGGLNPAGPAAFDDGARYDPANDAWLPMSSGPTERVAPVGGFGQSLVVFFGGTDESGGLVEGLDVYDTEQDEWRSDGFDGPTRRQDAAWADGDRTFWISGGRLSSGNPTDELSYYSYTSEEWTTANATPLSARWGGFGAFVAGQYYAWGGRDVDGLFDDGVRFQVGDWSELARDGAPAARYASHRESGWAWAIDDSSLALVGGLDAPSGYLRDGAIYDTTSERWSAIPAWPGVSSHAFGVAGIAGGEIVIWGGRNGSVLTNEGARYLLP